MNDDIKARMRDLLDDVRHDAYDTEQAALDALTALADRHVAAELQRVEQCETTTEWAVHWPAEGEFRLSDDEAAARELTRMYSTGAAVVLSRQVTPWTEVTA